MSSIVMTLGVLAIFKPPVTAANKITQQKRDPYEAGFQKLIHPKVDFYLEVPKVFNA
jgi:NADH:ubiquinone oxidoreductase subunit 3 (subunit A)